MAALKKALVEAEDKAAKERAAREKHEARVGEAQQELQDAIERFESLERDCKAQESEFAKPRQSAQDARAEAQRALQEIDAMKKIAAGKAFYMQSKHVKVNYRLLTRIRSSLGAFIDLPRSVSDAAQFYQARMEAQRRSYSGLSMLRPNTQCQ